MLCNSDPFVLFDQMGVTDASHAFYLGYELMKAKTALTLSKSYHQDQALEWGFLTEPEVSQRSRTKDRSRPEKRGTDRLPAEVNDVDSANEAQA
jgi:hypothetical protein